MLALEQALVSAQADQTHLLPMNWMCDCHLSSGAFVEQAVQTGATAAAAAVAVPPVASE